MAASVVLYCVRGERPYFVSYHRKAAPLIPRTGCFNSEQVGLLGNQHAGKIRKTEQEPG